MAGLPCTQWIARAAAEVLRAAEGPPELTLVYLPHLDYDTQRFGPEGCDWPKLVGELDAACGPVLDAAQQVGARVWVVNEYAHVQVVASCDLNRAFLSHRDPLLVARAGPFGEQLDTFASQAFAVCDHQIAHVYSRAPGVEDLLRTLVDSPTVERVLIGDERREIGLDHPRAGDAILLSKPDAWFAYYFWRSNGNAPDYARTVDIHRKPGYDPCELFFDPKLWWPKMRAMRKLIAKKLGFRTLFDVIPIDPELVRGSHGLPLADPVDKPVMVGDGAAPDGAIVHQCDVRDLVLRALGTRW
jgi:hypothetical protein